ncbi:MAG: hypothetical protein M1834_000179 [Cirrosporium novae-zelandiae]|nr:MAG: hypothetical protein M1834_000179 [Cirrosporium novae-zelandiae]
MESIPNSKVTAFQLADPFCEIRDDIDKGIFLPHRPTEFLSQPAAITNDIRRGTPGDSFRQRVQTPGGRDLAKKRSKYFDNAFASREKHDGEKEKIISQSPIAVELKTNIIIENEANATSGLCEGLAKCFHREVKDIMLLLEHSACIGFNGLHNPSYLMTITALPSELQPTMNKRYAVTVSTLLLELLGAPKSHGVIRFVHAAAENYAYNGATVLAHLEEGERHPQRVERIVEEVERLSSTLASTPKRTQRLNRMRSIGQFLKRKA